MHYSWMAPFVTLAPGEECEGNALLLNGPLCHPRSWRGVRGQCITLEWLPLLPSLLERSARVMHYSWMAPFVTLAPGEECEGNALLLNGSLCYPRSWRGVRGQCITLEWPPLSPSLLERSARVMHYSWMAPFVTLAPGEECQGNACGSVCLFRTVTQKLSLWVTWFLYIRSIIRVARSSFRMIRIAIWTQ